MEPRLTLETMGTLAGVVAFIELTMQLFWKRALRRLEGHPDHGLVMNLVALLTGFVGSVAAQLALKKPLSAEMVASTVFLAVEAVSVAVAGYELVKHVARSARGG